MRIAVVCPYSVSVPGGVQDQVMWLAREVRRLGHHVDVVAPCDGAVPPGVVAVGRSIDVRVNGSSAAMAPTRGAARRTVRALTAGDYDVVHLHEPLAPSITVPALLRSPAPLVGTFHAAGDRTPYRWSAPLARRLARRLDVRVAVSEAAAGLARRHLGGEYTVLYDGIDLERFRAVGTAPAARRTVLFLGRHEPRKGLVVLLQSVAWLPDDVEVRVAGDGPLRRRLEARFQGDGRVRWLGRLTEDEKLDELRSAGAVCVPSTHGESFGMVVLEAMAAGTPVVASDLPAYRAITADGTAAVLVPPADPRSLADALVAVLGDRPRADRLRAAGRSRAGDFALDALAERYVDIYVRLLAARGAPAVATGTAAGVTPSPRPPIPTAHAR